MKLPMGGWSLQAPWQAPYCRVAPISGHTALLGDCMRGGWGLPRLTVWLL